MIRMIRMKIIVIIFVNLLIRLIGNIVSFLSSTGLVRVSSIGASPPHRTRKDQPTWVEISLLQVPSFPSQQNVWKKECVPQNTSAILPIVPVAAQINSHILANSSLTPATPDLPPFQLISSSLSVWIKQASYLTGGCKYLPGLLGGQRRADH